MKKILRNAVAGAAVCVLAISTGLAADAYPTKPIRVLVGYSAGGPTDIIARVLAQDMSQTLGQAVIVENKPGASSMIATREVKAAAPDGYTLLFSSLGLTVNPILFGDKAGFNYQSDFAPISNAAVLPMVAVTAANSPIKSIPELIAKAKADPGGVSFGSSGTGGSGHLAGELLATQAKVQMMHVPFKGNGPALLEVIAGRVSFMLYPVIGLAEYVNANKVRVLAVGTKNRLQQFPDAPSMSEVGFADFEETAPWVGMLAPAKTSPEVVNKVHGAMVKALAKPEVKAQLEKLGAVVVGDTPTHFANYLQRDYERWGMVIKAGKVKME